MCMHGSCNRLSPDATTIVDRGLLHYTSKEYVASSPSKTVVPISGLSKRENGTHSINKVNEITIDCELRKTLIIMLNRSSVHYGCG